MKNPSGSTFQRTTSPECFRAVATGVGHDIGQSKATGEKRKALVRANTPNTIPLALPNEGFAAENPQSYVVPPRGKRFYGTFGDDTAANQAGSIPPNSSR